MTTLMTTLGFLRQYSFLIQRHGNAPTIKGRPDDERVLSDLGREQAEQAYTVRVAACCNPPSLVMSSPLLRAVATAAATSYIEETDVIRCPELAPACPLQRDTDAVNAAFERLKYVPLSAYMVDDTCCSALLAWSTQALETIAREIRHTDVQPREVIHITTHAVFGPTLALSLLQDTDQKDHARAWSAREAEAMIILPGGVFGGFLTP